MNDSNSEQVVLEIDESQVIQGTAKANAALDTYGKKAVQASGEAGKAFENHGGLVVRTSDRTRSSLERLTSAWEKQNAAYGVSPMEKVIADHDRLLSRIKAEPEFIERANQSFAKRVAAMNAATLASERAAAAAEKEALGAKKAADIARIVQTTETRAATFGTSGVGLLVAQRDLAIKGLGGEEAAIKKVTAEYAVMIAAERAGALASEKAAATSAAARIVEAAGTRAAIFGKSGVDLLIAQRGLAINGLAGEEAAIKKVTAEYAVMIATERAAKAQSTATAARLASRASQLEAHATSVSSGQRIIGNLQDVAQNPVGAASTVALEAASSIGVAGGIVAGAAIALGSVAAATYSAAKSLGEYAIGVENAATRTGLTTREVAQFGFAAKLVGQDISAFEHGMRGLTAAMDDSSSAGAKAREKLHDLGVVPRELNGELKSTGSVLLQISESLNKLPNVWERNAAGAEIFKRAWIEIGPAILGLSKGVNLANSAGLMGSSEEQIKHYIANLERIEVAEAKWDRFFRSLKAGLVDSVEFMATYGIPGVMGPILVPEGPRGKAPPGDHSWAAKNEALAAARERQAGNAILNAARERMATTPEGLKAKEAEAHEKYLEAYKNIQTLSDVGTEAAQKEIAKVKELGATYRRLSDQVKEIEKDESKRIANLVKVRDLMREGQTAYIIGTGALQTIVSGQQVFDANKTRGVPSLYGRGTLNPSAGLIPGSFEQDLKPGLQLLHGEVALVSPSAERQTEAPLELARAKAIGEGLDKLTRQPAELVAGINAETSATIRLLELRTEPGGEMDTARQVATLRRSALEEEYRLSNDIVRYRESSLQNELDLRQKLADIQHKQVDEIKGPVSSLFNTLFTKPREFGSQLASTLKGAILKPITEGLAGITADILHPAIFGKDGSGGISGMLHGIFGGGKRGIDEIQLVNGAVPVVVMGTGGGSAGSSAGGFSPAAGMFSRLARMGLSLPLAAAMAMGGAPTARMSGGEVIGGGDSTAGLSQRSSGLWQRGSGASNPNWGGTAGYSGTNPIWGGIGGVGIGRALNTVAGFGAGNGFGIFRGGEAIGGGDSTAGLTRLPSGLWQRGPGPSGDLSAMLGIGGTGGFSGGYGGPSGTTSGTRSNPLSGILGNLKGTWSNLKNINWGGLTREGGTPGGFGDPNIPGDQGTPGTDYTSGKITGVNGVAGMALSTGGMMLAQQGLLGSSRGTTAGIFEGALGGAMVGFSMGGPIGAAVGGIAGFGIGLGEKIAGVETPEREASRLIGQIYGLSIRSDSGTIKQVVAMARQNYGGTISIAVRSAPVRDLLQLYADSTGQRSSLLLAQQIHSASLTESGGRLYQSATYQNGTPYTYASPLPTLGPSGGTIPTANPMGGWSGSIHLNPQQTADLITTGATRAMANNPRAVSNANVNGNGQSATRLTSAGQAFDPGAIWA